MQPAHIDLVYILLDLYLSIYILFLVLIYMILSLILNSNCSLPTHRKVIDFCIFTLLLPCYNLLPVPGICVCVFKIFYVDNNVICEQGQFLFLPSQSVYLLYPFLIALATTSSMMLKRMAYKGYLCLVLICYLYILCIFYVFIPPLLPFWVLN